MVELIFVVVVIGILGIYRQFQGFSGNQRWCQVIFKARKTQVGLQVRNWLIGYGEAEGEYLRGDFTPVNCSLEVVW